MIKKAAKIATQTVTNNLLYRQTRKFVITIVGFTVLLIGVLMIVFPGPAIIVIPVALAILATEFVWAKKLLERIKAEIENTKNGIKNTINNNKNKEGRKKNNQK